MSEIPGIYPEGEKILIQVDDMERVTKGGIILPESSRIAEQRRLTTGKILRIGPDAIVRFSEDKKLCVGDRIVFALYGGFNLKDPDKKGRDFRLINDEDVLALIE